MKLVTKKFIEKVIGNKKFEKITLKIPLVVPGFIRTWKYFSTIDGKLIWYDNITGNMSFLNPDSSDTEDSLRDSVRKERFIDLDDIVVEKISNEITYEVSDFNRPGLFSNVTNKKGKALKTGTYMIKSKLLGDLFEFQVLSGPHTWSNSLICYEEKYKCNISFEEMDELEEIITLLVYNIYEK